MNSNSRAAYHSPLRQAQAAATREAIVAACRSLMQSGAEVTFGAVARAAGVQERTVYRHFPTKADLETAVWTWITHNLTHMDPTASTEEQLVGALREAFAGFEASAPLIRSMLRSQQGLGIRLAHQATREAMFMACVDDAAPGLAPERRRTAAAALQILYSAPAWELLREFWGMDAAEAAATAELGIRAVLDAVRSPAQPGGRPKDHPKKKKQRPDRERRKP